MPPPPGVERIDVETAQQMCEAVLTQFAWCDLLVMCAAVADWRPAAVHPGKLKKHDGEHPLRLVRTPDILRAVAADKGARYVVGFAAEVRKTRTPVPQENCTINNSMPSLPMM